MTPVEAIAAALRAGGLDLCAPLAAQDYNAAAPALPLPELGRRRTLALVIGNTRALWPRFVAALRAGALPARDPLDHLVEATVRGALAGWPGRREVRWGHHVPATVAIQRAAAVAGLAHLAASHLCVHPEYGPWLALRAVVVLDADGPPTPAPPVDPPCACARGCAPALAAALAAGAPASTAELAARWRSWLAVRDACPVGRAHRYDDDQLRYHYAGELPPT